MPYEEINFKLIHKSCHLININVCNILHLHIQLYLFLLWPSDFEIWAFVTDLLSMRLLKMKRNIHFSPHERNSIGQIWMSEKIEQKQLGKKFETKNNLCYHWMYPKTKTPVNENIAFLPNLTDVSSALCSQYTIRITNDLVLCHAMSIHETQFLWNFGLNASLQHSINNFSTGKSFYCQSIYYLGHYYYQIHHVNLSFLSLLDSVDWFLSWILYTLVNRNFFSLFHFV